jgi:transketolase
VESRLETRDRPVLLALTRQDVPTLDRGRLASAEGMRRGAYVLDGPNEPRPPLILLASGSEVGLVVAAADRLRGDASPCAVYRCRAGSCSRRSRKATAFGASAPAKMLLEKNGFTVDAVVGRAGRLLAA